MTLEIVPADGGRARAEFLDLPYRLHGRDPAFVPPLRRDARHLFDRARHPFFRHAEAAFFVARRAGRPVGRVEAVVNHAHNRFHDDRVGFFGAFECEDAPPTAAALLERAAAWLGARGRDVMRGPVTHSTNEQCGLQVEGFDAPAFVGMPQNPAYYAALLEGAGLRKAKDLHAWGLTLDEPPLLLRGAAARARRRAGVRVRPVDMRRYARETLLVMDLYNACWERNWGFVPLTEAEFTHTAEQLRPLIARHPGGLLIAEVDGRPAGFCLAVADANQALIGLRDGRLLPLGWLRLGLGLRRVNQARLLALGIRPEFRAAGLDAIFAFELLELGRRSGHRRVEIGWTLEDNQAVRTIIEHAVGVLGVRRTRTYRLYDRPLG